MKNTFKSILMISVLAVAGIFGVSSALINKQAEETPVVEKAEADGKTLYLKPGVWNTDNAWYAVYIIDTSSWHKSAMEAATVYNGASSSTYYHTTVPSSVTKVIFCRMRPKSASGYDGSNDGFNWNTKWNQTNDIDKSGDVINQRLVTITGWDQSNFTKIHKVITLTKTASVDGTTVDTQNVLGRNETLLVSSESNFPVPSRANKSGYTEGGWFTNIATSTSYTATTLSSDTTIYEKYTALKYEKGKRYYLCIDSAASGWDTANAWFAVYLYEPLDATCDWIRLNRVGDSHNFYFDMPSNKYYNKLVWIRLNPTYTESKLPSYTPSDGFWNQSYDVFKDGDKDFWFSSNASGTLSGTWTNLEDDDYRLFEGSLSPTPSSMRYWFCFVDGDEASSMTLNGGRPGLECWTGSDRTYYLMHEYENKKDADKFYFVDIPTSVDSFKILRVASGTITSGRLKVWQFQDTKLSVSSNMPSDLWKATFYFYDKNQYNTTCSVVLSSNSSGTYHASAYTMAKVLEAYYTCSSSTYNGYGAKNNLFNNFWNSKAAEGYNGSYTAANASGPWIYDYTYADYVAHGNSYNGCTRSGSYGMNVQTKWNALDNAQSRYGSGAIRDFTPFSLFGESEDSLSTVVIIVSSSIALLSITALSILVIKKRKSKEQE